MKRSGFRQKKRKKLPPGRGQDGWDLELRAACANCGGRGRHTLHHVIYGQRVRQEKGNYWDPRNALTLCKRCHENHHAGRPRLKLSKLRDANYEFALELLGPGKVLNYFEAKYADDGDPRFERVSELFISA
jgi:5-methylcytosine-specific restriction endonuclease McrA